LKKIFGLVSLGRIDILVSKFEKSRINALISKFEKSRINALISKFGNLK